MLTAGWLGENLAKLKLPSRAQQAANFIRLVGEHKLATGYDLPMWLPVAAQIGSANMAETQNLVRELEAKSLAINRGTVKLNRERGGELTASRYDLTLDGWERYEKERAGKFSGRYGFLALKCGDQTLDPFVRDVLKPAVLEALNYEVRDMRDVGRAGLIDNIMREQIRDSAFVVADLTHDNYGAYWEAGYAEGLGKPVIYICEKTKFEAAKTHFDTNHSTTVPWTTTDPDGFKRELIATLRRSLGLF